MGTRADFYVGEGPEAEWLGSTGWDGYPEGITPEQGEWPEGEHLFDAGSEDEFRQRVARYFEGRRDVTLPEEGWPWPWETSHTTDYAYAWTKHGVRASNFGSPWFDPRREPEDEVTPDFPDMTARKNVKLGGPASGIIVLG